MSPKMSPGRMLAHPTVAADLCLAVEEDEELPAASALARERLPIR
jgi:hypothetical protein